MRRSGLIAVLLGVLFCFPAQSQPDFGTAVVAPVQTDSLQPVAGAAPADTLVPHLRVQEAPALPAQDSVATQPAIREGASIGWPAAFGLLGILVGAAGHWLITRRALLKRRAAADLDAADDGLTSPEGGPDRELMLEQDHAELSAINNALHMENEQLKREVAEIGQLLRSSTEAAAGAGDEVQEEFVFYMPQPNMMGRFQEASRRSEASDALYAFHVRKSDPDQASFEFIARDAYLNAAIGNEPTWIAIACERSNQPSASTSRVRTDQRGLATLRNGEWEITRKASITYL